MGMQTMNPIQIAKVVIHSFPAAPNMWLLCKCAAEMPSEGNEASRSSEHAESILFVEVLVCLMATSLSLPVAATTSAFQILCII